MARRGDICENFDGTLFRYFVVKRYKYQKTFASRMGVSTRIVSAWLSGQKKPTYKNLFKIADILKVDPRQLLTRHGRQILDEWQLKLMFHLFDNAPIEIKTTIDAGGNKITTTIVRPLDREAQELTDRLGYFDQRFDEDEGIQTAAEKYYDDLTDEVPEAYKDEEQSQNVLLKTCKNTRKVTQNETQR